MLNDPILLQIGRKIRSIRKGQGATLQVIAEKAGVSKGLISKIENGHTVPSMPVMLSIISALGTEPASFFEGFDFLQDGGYIHLPASERPQAVQKGHFSEAPLLHRSISGGGVDISIREMFPEQAYHWSPMGGCSFIYILEGHLKAQLNRNPIELTAGDGLFYSNQMEGELKNPSGDASRWLQFQIQVN